MRVVVVDFDMPIWSMVVFMLKWAIASIPAAVIFGVTTLALWWTLYVLLHGPARP
jgi:hypothetical protein